MTKLQKQLAENIRFYRKKKGMTQENLAEKVGTATNLLEGLKSATKMALLILMRVFFKTRLFTAVFHFIAKRLFQQLPNLKIRSLLKIKERL